MKIEKLTAEQEAMLSVYADKYIKIGLNTDAIDFDKAVAAVKETLAFIDFDYSKTKFIYAASPRDYHKNTAFEHVSFGTNDSYRLGYYKFFSDNFNICNEITAIEQMIIECGWVYHNAKTNTIVICDRPEKISIVDGVLSCENGPAILFRDGFSVYSWRGTRVPGVWVENPESITSEVFLSHPDAEERRCACEIVGWAKVLEKMKAVVIDADGDPEIGTLMEVEIPDVGKERFIKVMCGTKREFALPVPPHMKTALEAQAWMFGLDPSEFKIPEIRT